MKNKKARAVFEIRIFIIARIILSNVVNNSILEDVVSEQEHKATRINRLNREFHFKLHFLN